jgi:hypothetical protein
MLYSLEVVKIKLEQVRVTGVSGDHSGVASPLFSREGGNLVEGTATPRVVHHPPCPVPSSPTTSSN